MDQPALQMCAGMVSEWGTEVPELQKLAFKLVPLIIGSGPAERAWKDIGNILIKNRNRLGVDRCIDLVYVRMWLRRELKLVSDAELEQFKEWETKLFEQTSFYCMTGTLMWMVQQQEASARFVYLRTESRTGS